MLSGGIPGELLDPENTDLNHEQGTERAGGLQKLCEVHTVPPYHE